jgi:hypothetical protein
MLCARGPAFQEKEWEPQRTERLVHRPGDCQTKMSLREGYVSVSLIVLPTRAQRGPAHSRQCFDQPFAPITKSVGEYGRVYRFLEPSAKDNRAGPTAKP